MDNTSYFANLGRAPPQQQHYWDKSMHVTGWTPPKPAIKGMGWASELLPHRPGSFAEALLGPTYRPLTPKQHGVLHQKMKQMQAGDLITPRDPGIAAGSIAGSIAGTVGLPCQPSHSLRDKRD